MKVVSELWERERIKLSSRLVAILVLAVAAVASVRSTGGQERQVHPQESHAIPNDADHKERDKSLGDRIFTGTPLLTCKGHTSVVQSIAFSPNGQRLASGSLDKTVRIWNATTGQELLTLRGHTEGVWFIAYSPDGKRVASASIDGTVKVWDAEAGQQLLTLIGHTNRVVTVAFSPDGKWLVSAGWDKIIRVWDAGTGHQHVALSGHVASIFGLAFSPDSKRLASTSVDIVPQRNSARERGEIKVWDFPAGKELINLRTDEKGIWCVTFSPDGQTLATGSGERDVVLWDATNGRQLRTFQVAKTGLIHSIAFSPDGTQLATAGLSDTAKLWDSMSGTELIAFQGTRPLSVAFSPDGKGLASAGIESTIKIWGVALAK